MILTIFYGCLCVALALVIVAATSLYLERKKLFTLADGAALVGAESFPLAGVRLDDGNPRLTLHPETVRRAAAEYLRAVQPAFGAELVEATTSDGVTATVTLASFWRPPAVSMFVPDGVRVEVTAVARSVLD